VFLLGTPQTSLCAMSAFQVKIVPLPDAHLLPVFCWDVDVFGAKTFLLNHTL
jgi:hypothetical protein